jgi:primosomal protein N' (replication factor Y)
MSAISPTHSPYIDVAVTLPVFGTFTYAIPDHLAHAIAVGKRVLVPFGRRLVTGFILKQLDKTDLTEVRPIQAVLDEIPLFPASLLPFYGWISDYYLHPIGHVIKSALPGGLVLYEITQVVITELGTQFLATHRAPSLEVEVLKSLSHGPSSLKDLRKRVGQSVPRASIDSMAAAGWIRTSEKLRGGQTRLKTERYVRLAKQDQDADLSTIKLSTPKKELLALLKTHGNLATRNLKNFLPTATRHLKALQRTGHVQLFEQHVYRDPFGETIEPSQPPDLTGEQIHVIEQVTGALGKGFAAFLLAGVTGSGKTEVYLQIAAETIRRGHNVLILVPEIALISQMERRFRARFGERIAVLHSGLSDGERFDQWQRILQREVPIAIGAESPCWVRRHRPSSPITM